jgi:hypothetical protein
MLITKHLLVVALLAFLTTACDSDSVGGDGVGSDSSEQTNTLQSPSESANTSSQDVSDGNMTPQNNTTQTDSAVTAVNSMAVKGPLAGAAASLYRINTSNDGFTGELVAEGFTDTDAQLMMDIENRFLNESFFIMEYTLGKELNGSTPVIPTLRTLISSEQLLNNTAIFATPLTTLAIDNAIYRLMAENSGGTISIAEFDAAVKSSALQAKATFGLGILDDDVNIFTSSPILSEDTDQNKSLAYRTTIEVFAALAEKVKVESEALGETINAEALVKIFAEDMLDGSLDGANNGDPINKLSALGSARVQQILSIAPSTLTIPGTDNLISELINIIAFEAAQVAPLVAAETLTQPSPDVINLNVAAVTAPSSITSNGTETQEAQAIAQAEVAAIAQAQAIAQAEAAATAQAQAIAQAEAAATAQAQAIVQAEAAAIAQAQAIAEAEAAAIVQAQAIAEAEAAATAEAQAQAIAEAEAAATAEAQAIADAEAAALAEAQAIADAEAAALAEAQAIAEAEAAALAEAQAIAEAEAAALAEAQAIAEAEAAALAEAQAIAEAEAAALAEAQAALVSVNITWAIPTTRANGDALLASDLSGYEIYYTTDNAASATYSVENGNTSAVTLDGLAPDTYYFAISAIDTQGIKSELSGVVSLVVETY